MEQWLVKFKNQVKYKEWQMKELVLTDKSLYGRYIKQTNYPADIWAGNFAYLWAQTKSDKLTVFHATVNKMLVTFSLTKRGRLFLPCLPCGKASLDKIVDVLIITCQYCNKWNKVSGYTHKSSVIPIDSCQLKFLQKSEKFNHLFNPLELTGIERHFSIPKLIGLKGKEFSRIRYKLNKFNRLYPNVKIRKYQNEDLRKIMELGRYWENTAGKNYKRIRDRFYFEDLTKNNEKLDIKVLVVQLEDEIIGMTSGGILPTGKAWGVITKFNNDFEGLAEYLVIEMIKEIHRINPKVELINAGTDLGSKGLAMAKEKFRPVKRCKRYALFFQNEKI